MVGVAGKTNQTRGTKSKVRAPSIQNSQRQPVKPLGPFICVKPKASTPPKALEKALKAKMTDERFPRSDLLYTDPR